MLSAVLCPLAAFAAFLMTLFVATFPWENVEAGEGNSAVYVAAMGLFPASLIPVAIWRRSIRGAVALFIVSAAIYAWWGLLFAEHPVT